MQFESRLAGFHSQPQPLRHTETDADMHAGPDVHSGRVVVIGTVSVIHAGGVPDCVAFALD